MNKTTANQKRLNELCHQHGLDWAERSAMLEWFREIQRARREPIKDIGAFFQDTRKSSHYKLTVLVKRFTVLGQQFKVWMLDKIKPALEFLKQLTRKLT